MEKEKLRLTIEKGVTMKMDEKKGLLRKRDDITLINRKKKTIMSKIIVN